MDKLIGSCIAFFVFSLCAALFNLARNAYTKHSQATTLPDASLAMPGAEHSDVETGKIEHNISTGDESHNDQPKANMTTNEYEVIIPQGVARGNGYVEMRHNTQYSLRLKNNRRVKCDAEVSIDGIHIGTWRIKERGEIQIERPVHDTGCFTFFEVGTEEAKFAGISKNTQNGLVSVTFKPEFESVNTSELPSRYNAGATGLTGESKQKFVTVAKIDHDEARCFTIHLRLVAHIPDIRPLAPRATPVPPPID